MTAGAPESDLSSPIRLAALGCGRVLERFHLPALRRSRDWRLTAAVDPSADRLRWITAVAPDIAVAASLGELDRAAGFDAVLVASPPDTHCALASEGLRRGAHVLIEKPMVLRPAEAVSLLELARDVGRQVWVGFNRRFRPAYLAVREHLGRIPAERLRGIDFTLRSTPLTWGALTGYLSAQERGGGLLDDIASHQLDLLPWLVARSVEEVRARLARREADLEIAIDLRFAGGLSGCCRAAHASAAAEVLRVRLAHRTLTASPGGIAGSRWTPESAVRGYLAVRTAMGSMTRRARGAPGFTSETFEAQLAAWAGALRGLGPGPAADGVAGLRCVELVEACRQSLAVGGAWVPVPEPAPASR